MKTPYEEVIGVYRDNLDTAIENDKSAQKFLDSFTIWLLGFSVGSIALLVGNIEALTKHYSYWSIKLIIILLALSTISGILHRLFLFNLTVKYNKALYYVRGALSDKDIMQTEIVDVSKVDNIEEIVNLLQWDFDLDFTKELELYKTIDNENDKKILFDSLVSYYQKTNQWAKTSFDNGIAYITKIMKDVYLYNEKDFISSIQGKNPNLRKLDAIQTLCLYFNCFCFILAIIVMIICY